MKITPKDANRINREICEVAPVIPVLTVENVEIAKPLAQALVAGGLPTLEVTLRTPCALDVIQAMSEVEGATVGAGTLITPQDVKNAKDAGAKFGVSPGSTNTLIAACEEYNLPIIGGVSTVSEAMCMLEKGYDFVKCFPAQASGGASALKAIGGPLPQISFCPTGGISPQNVESYLALSNVVCVGGSWVSPKDLIEGQKWDKIQELASHASTLKKA